MKVIGLSLLIIALGGCGSLQGRTPTDSRHADAEEQKSQLIHSHQQTLSLANLMLQRQELCRISASERSRLVDDYWAIFIADKAESVSLQSLLPKRRHQLNALMLATCDPAKTPGFLSEMLRVVTAEDDWPEEYMAFFDLLVTSHKAYSVLGDKLERLNTEYQNLQNEYEALQVDYERLQAEHENTIKGISDIERGIDIPDAENPRLD